MPSGNALDTRFDAAAAVELAGRVFGLRVQATGLPSYVDENFLLETEDGERFVLKIANADEERALLDAQNEVMTHLAGASVAVPEVRRATDGSTLSTTPDRSGRERLVRLLTYLPGELLVHATPHSSTLLESLGRFLGELDGALADFSHPALHRELRWDLVHALDARAHLGTIDDPSRRRHVESVFDRFEAAVLPALRDVRHGVIHNDANDYNVLVESDPTPRVSGVIDFGDVVHTAIVCELAIALAYAMLEKPDPIAAGACVVRGYHGCLPMDGAEVELLPDLVEARLAVSVTLSAHGRTVAPENEYLDVTEEHAWRLLDRLQHTDRRDVTSAFRRACPGTPGATR